MRRRSGTSPFQLFSFQDIITSVMGIVVLILLVLAVELSRRKLDSIAGRNADTRKQIEFTIEEIEREIAQLRQSLAAGTLGEVTKLSPSELQAKISESDAAVKTLAKREQDLQKRLSSAQKESNRLAKKLEAVAGSEETKVKKAIASDLAKSVTAASQKGKIFFRASPGESRVAWLVELASDRFSVAPASDPSQSIHFRGSRDKRTSDLRSWLQKLDARQSYLHILVKPSQVDSFHELEDTARKEGIAFGFDLLGAQEFAISPPETN